MDQDLPERRRDITNDLTEENGLLLRENQRLMEIHKECVEQMQVSVEYWRNAYLSLVKALTVKSLFEATFH